MLVHSVYFWLKDGLSSEEKQSFEKGLKSLSAIESVKDIFIGDPASTNRPVIDRSYSYGLVVIFENIEGHDLYQAHPLHKAFLELYSSYWNRVLIYDFNSR
jgi:hypothetical protein